MSEKPIIFSTPMVKAILEGRKTMTRRVIRPQPQSWHGDYLTGCEREEIKQRIYPGDILWVRETWAMEVSYSPDPEAELIRYLYKADGSETFRWHPSIHMPRAAARIFLRVTDVRVERVQDINEKDVAAEGIAETGNCDELCVFADLWDSLNAKRGFGWEANPWVWVVSFERSEA
jgi:hypothetical protein